jgi:hypothetical protein
MRWRTHLSKTDEEGSDEDGGERYDEEESATVFEGTRQGSVGSFSVSHRRRILVV